MNWTKRQGFTLIELMATIAIAGIALTVAMPAMSNFIQNNKLTTQTNDFIAGVRAARGEAIKRGVDVSLESKSGDWGNGWELKDDGANILKQIDGESGVTSSTVTNTITFNSKGVRTDLNDLDVKLCDSRGKGRKITLTGLGGFTSVCKLGYGADSCAAGSCP